MRTVIVAHVSVMPRHKRCRDGTSTTSHHYSFLIVATLVYKVFPRLRSVLHCVKTPVVPVPIFSSSAYTHIRTHGYSCHSPGVAFLLLPQSLHDAHALLAQRDPKPEPRDHLDEDKGEDDTILEAVGRRAAPAAKEARFTAGAVGVDAQGARRSKGVAVKDEAHGEDESNGCLGAPVVERAQLLGHGEGDEVAQT